MLPAPPASAASWSCTFVAASSLLSSATSDHSSHKRAAATDADADGDGVRLGESDALALATATTSSCPEPLCRSESVLVGGAPMVLCAMFWIGRGSTFAYAAPTAPVPPIAAQATAPAILLLRRDVIMFDLTSCRRVGAPRCARRKAASAAVSTVSSGGVGSAAADPNTSETRCQPASLVGAAPFPSSSSNRGELACLSWPWARLRIGRNGISSRGTGRSGIALQASFARGDEFRGAAQQRV